MTTDQELLAAVEDINTELDTLTTRVAMLEADGGTAPLGEIYDLPTGSTVVNAYALQRICVDGKVLGEACLQHPDQLVREAAGEMLSWLQTCGYPQV